MEQEKTYEGILQQDKNQPIDKVNRSYFFIEKREVFEKADNEYWKRASIKEKLQSVTYLRECFYGKEATTDRLQRVYTISKLK